MGVSSVTRGYGVRQTLLYILYIYPRERKRKFLRSFDQSLFPPPPKPILLLPSSQRQLFCPQSHSGSGPKGRIFCCCCCCCCTSTYTASPDFFTLLIFLHIHKIYKRGFHPFVPQVFATFLGGFCAMLK